MFPENLGNETGTDIDGRQNDSGGGWSFLQALSNVCQSSSLRLSEISLQLCTENLGNETGTDIDGNSIDLLCSSSERSGSGARDSPTREQTRAAARKRMNTQNFPPPLTTMRGSESLRVRPHREGGRLVIEAVKVPPSASCFKAERSHVNLYTYY